MRTTLVMTIIGPDRTGLVDALARPIAEHGGNWLESRMCRLGGQFAGLARVEVDSANADALRGAIDRFSLEGVTATVQADTTTPAQIESSTVNVELVGQDRTGLLREITGVFARHNLNVEDLTSEVTEAPQGGGMIFRADATVSLPSTADLDAIGDDLEKIATDLMVDISLAPDGG
jgi:glycine cleavage system regulatory protein